jgi:hypothetical protein
MIQKQGLARNLSPLQLDRQLHHQRLELLDLLRLAILLPAPPSQALLAALDELRNGTAGRPGVPGGFPGGSKGASSAQTASGCRQQVGTRFGFRLCNVVSQRCCDGYCNCPA